MTCLGGGGWVNTGTIPKALIYSCMWGYIPMVLILKLLHSLSISKSFIYPEYEVPGFMQDFRTTAGQDLCC